MQQMQLDLVAKIKKGHYVYDPECLVLSAPKIIIGHVDRNGTLLGGGSEVIIRGTQVGVQGAGEGGTVEVRASSIRHIAEDPGVDGLEHVVGTLSEIISQARNIIIQSNEVKVYRIGTVSLISLFSLSTVRAIGFWVLTPLTSIFSKLSRSKSLATSG